MHNYGILLLHITKYNGVAIPRKHNDRIPSNGICLLHQCFPYIGTKGNASGKNYQTFQR